MESIPLPSHIHYELLLQLLERESLYAAYQQPAVREHIQQLIITLRKALAQQKQIENICEQSKMSIDYLWSLNQEETKVKTMSTEPLSSQFEH